MATLDTLAGRIVTLVEALGTSQTVKGYQWEPGMTGFDTLPACVVGLPTIGRVDIDEPDSQLNDRDWFITFPLDLYFRLDNSSDAADLAVEVVDALIVSVDSESLQTADPRVFDAKLVSSEPVLDLSDQAQPLLRYECQLRVWYFVAQT